MQEQVGIFRLVDPATGQVVIDGPYPEPEPIEPEPDPMEQRIAALESEVEGIKGRARAAEVTTSPEATHRATPNEAHPQQWVGAGSHRCPTEGSSSVASGAPILE